MPRKANSVDPRTIQRLKLIDEFIDLDRQVDDFRPLQTRHQKLRELILDWHPNLAPEDEALISGSNRDILISSRDKLRKVTAAGKLKLFKKWGAKGFVARAEVLLRSLPDPKDELGLYTQTTLSGPRHLHVVTQRQKTAAASPAA